MRFRPCIDIHNGSVKQIVGGSLKDEADRATENFVSELGADFYAQLYKEHGLKGGHIIILNPAGSEYYSEDVAQAEKALTVYPDGLQIGGGINAENATEFIAMGASQVIVTSYVFKDGHINYDNLEKLVDAVGREHIVLDLSCRKRDGKYYIVTDRWQKFTEEIVCVETLDKLSGYCSEYLIHAVDVEGKASGIEKELAELLGDWGRIPMTYAGGVGSFEDLGLLKRLGRGKLDVTIGSALDIFGGHMKFEDVLRFCDDEPENENIQEALPDVAEQLINEILADEITDEAEPDAGGSGNINRVNGWLRRNFCIYMPAVIISVIMLAIFIVEKITPFGPNSLTIIDSIHQYVPFFSDYRDKILNGGSFFYTWDVALGSNFMSLGAYYLSSPFNLLLVLFPKKYLVAGVCIIVSLKIALSGSSMAYYLMNSVDRSRKKARPLNDWYIIALALAYALSNYVIGYYWNTMWMDCIMIFPLIMLGFKRLMDENRPLMYCLTLFYALFCNYYIGFMICVFLVLWFFVYPHKRVAKFFTDGIKFAVASLCAGGMSAILLLPAYFGINATAAGEKVFPKWSLYYENFASIFKQQLVLTEPITNMNFDGGVNLYCSTLVIFTLVLYIIHPFNDGKGGRYISVGEKIRTIIVMAFIAVSFNATTLNYIWHGFHDQYGIPNRFSFLYIFILVNMANSILAYLDRIKPVHTFVAMITALVGVTICYMSDIEEISILSVILTLLLIFAYALIFLLRTCRYIRRETFNIIIAAVLGVEMAFSGVYGFLQNGSADYDYYYSESDNVQAAYDRSEELAGDDSGFYRSELMKSTVLDEATWYNMRSVGTFCSTVLGDLVTAMGKLGFYTGANEFLYHGSTPFTSSLLNVRYIFRRAYDLNNFDFNYVETVDDVEIYENPYPLSIGFAVNDNVKDWNSDEVERLYMQNTLAYDMTGISGLFTMVYPRITGYSENCDVSVDQNVITFTPNQTGAVKHTETFTVDSSGDYYVNCRGNYITKIRFYINGQEFAHDRYQIQIFHLGNLDTGDVVTVDYEYDSAPTETTTAALSVAKYDEQIYQEIYTELSSHMLTDVTYKDGYVKGNVDMPAASTLFTSIPYDEGWSVRVDGEECEYYEILGGFIGVDMGVGQHTVEFTYTPVGFKPGALISLTSLVVMFGFVIVLRVMGKKNKKI